MPFSELVKNLVQARRYLRDFYLFGYRTREEYETGRSYDNERRRIESWLGESMLRTRAPGGRSVSLCLDASDEPRNPLYALWGTKSFTRNDILLHFLLLDLLSDGPPLTADEAADALAERWGKVFGTAIVRLKLNEYAELGLLNRTDSGRRHRFALASLRAADLGEDLLEAVDFFTEAAPFGQFGARIQDDLNRVNTLFRFKHAFPVHTLDDGNLLALLTAMDSGRTAVLKHRDRTVAGTPVKILFGLQSGRRYGVLHEDGKFFVCRLDRVDAVGLGEPDPESGAGREAFEALLPRLWGASLPHPLRSEPVRMVLSVDPEREGYVTERLRREGRGGTVTERGDGTVVYEHRVADSLEMLPFLRTFIGRILKLKGRNRWMIRRFHEDLLRMAALYALPSEGGLPHGSPEAPETPSPAREKSAATPGAPGPDRVPEGERCEAAEALFHEVFGRYYVIVARLLEQAAREGALDRETLWNRAAEWGFAETPALLIPALTEGEWPLFQEEDGRFVPRVRARSRPLSALEKRWLAALLEDERMGLFLRQGELARWRDELAGVPPLFRASDLHAFDRSRDPDPFRDARYRRAFRTVLRALRERRFLWVRFTSGHGREFCRKVLPRRLQYSLKDDKFRLLARRFSGGRPGRDETINLGRIRGIALKGKYGAADAVPAPAAQAEPVVLLLTEERQAMERALLHFASFPCRPQAGPDGERLLHILHEPQDEAELLIRVLAFGPLVRVLGPEPFAEQIRQRLQRQVCLWGSAGRPEA